MSASVELDTATRLRGAIGSLSRAMRRTAADVGLTPTQSSVLASVVRHGPVKLAELGEREALNPTSLSRAVGHLEKLGLAERSRDDVDARALWVSATEHGRQTQGRIRLERARALDEHLDGLTVEHRRALDAAMPALEALAESVTGRSA